MSEIFGIVDTEIIEKLADIINRKELSELTIADGDKTITLKGRKCLPPPPQMPFMGVLAAQSAPVPAEENLSASEAEAAGEISGKLVKSPIVGTFYGTGGSSFTIGSLAASTIAQTVENKADSKDHLFSRTDLRMVGSIRYQYSSGSAITVYPIFKYLPTQINIRDAENVWSQELDNVEYSPAFGRSQMNCNWIIYRMPEIMLMRAEATASMANPDSLELVKVFDMVKTIFDRSNPMISTTDDIKQSDYATAKDILELVMRERQREFFAEGKRWFDLVRMAMREGSTNGMLNLLTKKYTSNSSAIKAKLATLNSLYNPVYREEMKVNPALVQNPAWITDETIVRN